MEWNSKKKHWVFIFFWAGDGRSLKHSTLVETLEDWLGSVIGEALEDRLCSVIGEAIEDRSGSVIGEALEDRSSEGLEGALFLESGIASRYHNPT